MSTMLFSPLKIREVTFKNRIFVSPMCQYSAVDGVPNDWHFVHLGSRAVGGAALVICEATGVNAAGRISPGCLGLWNEKQMMAFARITKFVHENGACAGIQLAHSGRKGSTQAPWLGSGAVIGPQAWEPVAPSAEKFNDSYPLPHELSEAEIKGLTADFARSAKLALAADFDVVELHFAHGYLAHEFLSPLVNKRQDRYGGSLENRMRFALDAAEAVRAVWPADKPLFARVSATDWTQGGWDIDQTIELARSLKVRGIDFIDCSTGGAVAHAKIPVGPGYQVQFAESVRKNAGILTGAVGMITEAKQAEEILASGKADAVLLARELLRDPYWPLHAAKALGSETAWPKQYERAK
jgi:2,4-dienoyl-CoA reductase-like NADH-dependent reductase (Old Yellow Enzyme family)